VVPFQQGETISESLAMQTRQSVPEVHARLSLPFLRVPNVGVPLTRALTNEFRQEALRGRVDVLNRTREIYAAALEKVEEVPKGPRLRKGQRARDVITERRLNTLLTNLRTATILAERVREGP